MQIKLLGTGSAEGLPGLFCKCHICEQARILGGKDIRSRCSALVDGSLKIDLPPDTFYHSVRLGLRMADVSAIVFTHSHDDHLAEAELQYLSWMFVPEPRKEPLLIAGSATVIDKIRAGVNLERVNLELIELEAWQTRAVGDWNVTPIIANHDPTKICFNLIIERDGSSLLYATDTGWYGEETWKFLEGVRLAGVVVEASRAAHETYPGHLSLDDVIRFKDRLVSQETIIAGAPVVTTHHSHRSGLLHAQIEPLVEPSGIAVGYDGMEFTI